MRLHGLVKWFAKDKGFGFITCCGEDYFVHLQSVKKLGLKTLLTRTKIEFDVVLDPRGSRAENLKILALPVKKEQKPST